MVADLETFLTSNPAIVFNLSNTPLNLPRVRSAAKWFSNDDSHVPINTGLLGIFNIFVGNVWVIKTFAMTHLKPGMANRPGGEILKNESRRAAI